MKRTLAVFLALILSMSVTMTAFASTTVIGTVTLESEDFFLTIDNTTQYEQAEKAEANTFLVLYPKLPDNQFTTNINFLWQAASVNVSLWDDSDLEVWAENALDSTLTEFEALGLSATNVRILESRFDEVGGKTAIFIAFSYDVDFSGMGAAYKGYVVSVCSCQWMISESGLGTYFITGSCTDPEEFYTVCEPIVDTIRWK